MRGDERSMDQPLPNDPAGSDSAAGEAALQSALGQATARAMADHLWNVLHREEAVRRMRERGHNVSYPSVGGPQV